jgi:hypothetical protein
VFGTGTVDAHLHGMGLKVLYQRRRRPKPKTLKGGAMMFHHPVASKFPEKSIVIKENRTPSSFAAHSHPDLHGDVLDLDGYASGLM